MRFAGVWEPFSPSGRDAEGREGIRLCRLSPHPIPLLKERGMQVSYFKRFNREIIIELRYLAFPRVINKRLVGTQTAANARADVSAITSNLYLMTSPLLSPLPNLLTACLCK